MARPQCCQDKGLPAMGRKEDGGHVTLLVRRGTIKDNCSLVEVKWKRLVMCSKVSAVFAESGVLCCRPSRYELASEVKKHRIVLYPKFFLPFHPITSFGTGFKACCIFVNLKVLFSARLLLLSQSCNNTLYQTVPN